MSARTLYRFNGGVHPPEHKSESSGTAIVAGPLPAQLVLPLRQSIGNAAKPLVAVGERVLKGQMIAAADGSVSAALHAPTSGTVLAIEERLVAHPSGLTEASVVIDSDGLDAWCERTPFDWRAAQAASDGRAIRDYLRDMGVVGLGGAVFPSHLKLAGRDVLDTLIINGAECEPYITCDDRLMRERAADIVAGVEIVRQLLSAREVLIGIEDNKSEAVAALRCAIAEAGAAVDVVVVPTLYPSGGAKQLIKLLTNIEVPSGVRSTDLGVQCFNVATVYTIYRALEHAEPVISRVVTLTGNVARPGNVEALIGTPLADLMAFAGEQPGTREHIYGGPMMGFALPGLEAGLTKAGNCIIATAPADFPDKGREMPCIRCGECASACPAELQPMDLYWFARSREFGRAQERNLFDCIECGACAYVCPSSIRLVDYYRFAKSEIWAAEANKKAADKARERHEFKQFREEREKREKAERLAARQAAAAKPATTADAVNPAAADNAEAKAAKIRAAMARAAERKAAGGEAGSDAQAADAMDAEKRAKIAAAMEKAAARKAHLESLQAGEAPAAEAIDEAKAEKIRAAMEAAALRKAARDAAKVEAGTEPVGDAAAIDDAKAAKIRAAMEAAAQRKAHRESLQAAAPVVDAVPAAPAPALDPEKAERIRAAMQKREEEKARLAAMSPEERAALDAERQARIDAAKARAAAKGGQ
ncbi:electron transport complex subunit RsxC [Jeongeupia sp. USM3]|uniref:electron transport complex subunit RsxC n=1 Tax=Jeongeupia sp. USM3 TaxID=1906741 RepID=UPI00089DE85A|nr:electron transport complex subunit RsxC [Jeongeupia sp. USM3]AOY00406.1 electron transport complex subunit RsxC [Jeongeupia sp. USM3]